MIDRLNYSNEWELLPWKQFERALYNLQQRIFKASKKNGKDRSKVKQLQRLLIKSECARYLAVRNATWIDINKKKTDRNNILVVSPKERFKLVYQLKNIPDWEQLYQKKAQVSNLNKKINPAITIEITTGIITQLILYAVVPEYPSLALIKSLSKDPKIIPGPVEKNPLVIGTDRYFASDNSAPLKNALPKSDNESVEYSENVCQESANSFVSSKKVLDHNEKTSVNKIHKGFYKPQLKNNHVKNRIYLTQKIKILSKLNIGKYKKVKSIFCGSSNRLNFPTNHFIIKNKMQSLKKSIKKIMKDTKLPMQGRLAIVNKTYKSWLSNTKQLDVSKSFIWNIKHWIYKYMKKNCAINKEKILAIIHVIFANPIINTYKPVIGLVSNLTIK